MTVSIATIWQPPSHTYRSNLWMCQCFNLHKKEHPRSLPSMSKQPLKKLSLNWFLFFFMFERFVQLIFFLASTRLFYFEVIEGFWCIWWCQKRLCLPPARGTAYVSQDSLPESDEDEEEEYDEIQAGFRAEGTVLSVQVFWCLQGGPRIQLYMEFFRPEK